MPKPSLLFPRIANNSVFYTVKLKFGLMFGF